MSEKIIRVLFVCTGNICRSPMAEAVFQHMVKEAHLEHRFEIASAATTDEEIGARPHRGTLGILREKGIMISPDKRAVQVTRESLADYEYIIGMTGDHVRELRWLGSEAHRLLEFAPDGTRRSLDVPDPYYSGNFELVYDLVSKGCRGLLAYIRQNEGL